jgi:putative tryptophan/tyrosine transport system substrate-binding protein
VNRRDFITLLGGAAATWPLAARAQETARIPRIGYLSPGSASGGFQARDDAFRQALHDLGYVDGRTIAIEYRFAEGRFDRLAELAAELVRLKVDVIVAVVTQASLAAKDATSSIPIVMVAVFDPVGSGLVTSLRHPGANVTGTSGMTGQVVGKSLQLLRQVAPESLVLQSCGIRAIPSSNPNCCGRRRPQPRYWACSSRRSECKALMGWTSPFRI